MIQKITPFFWFNNQAEEATNFYVSIFRNSTLDSVVHYGDGAPVPKGTVMSTTFTLDGQQFMALNGGPAFQFTPAISLFVTCDTQEEVDYFWIKLTEGGSAGKCGWLTDKYGISWQIIPKQLGELLNDPDPAKSKKTMDAMLTMSKIDIPGLRRAHDE